MIVQPLFNAPIHYTKSLGNLHQEPTCVDKAVITGVYTFVGGTESPIDSSWSTEETSAVYGDWSLLVVENGTNILQVAERLGITDRRIIYTRTYSDNAWSDWLENKTKIDIDDTLSDTSTNPVQNKVVNQELNKKLNVSGGTMKGELKAQSNANYTSYQVRNMAFSTSASLPTGNGSVLGVYS